MLPQASVHAAKWGSAANPRTKRAKPSSKSTTGLVTLGRAARRRGTMLGGFSELEVFIVAV